MKNRYRFVVVMLLLAACSGLQADGTELDVPVADVSLDEPTPAVQEPAEDVEPTDAPGGTSPSVPDEVSERFAITSMSYASFAQITEFPLPDTPRAVAFSPDSRLLAVALGNSDVFDVYIWDLELGELMLVLREHEGIVWDVAFSPDGRMIASSSADGTVCIWRTADGELLRRLEHPGDISAIAFSPDGTVLAAGGVKEWPVAAVWLYDTQTWALIDELEAAWNIPGIVFFPERGYIAGGGISRNVSVWSESSGEELFLLYHPGQVQGLDRDRDGDLLITGPCIEGEDYDCVASELWAWDMADGTIAYQAGVDTTEVNGLDVSPLGDLLVVAGEDRLLRLFAVDDLSLTAYYDTGEGRLFDAVFSPDATYVAVAGTDEVQLWGIVPPGVDTP